MAACGGTSDTNGRITGGGGSSGGSSSGGGAQSGTTDVTTYHYDTMRSGQNLTEMTLTPSNVASASFGLLRIINTDGPVDAAPLIAANLVVNGGTHNVLYVASEHDTVYAFDADSGAMLARASMLAVGESPSDDRNCGQVSPEIGITATPVIDRRIGPNGTLYLVAMSKDSGGHYYQRLHALDLVSLADRLPPTVVAATSPSAGPNSSNGVLRFDPKQYKERGALLAINAQVFTVWASHCDIAPYNGWIMAYDENSLAQTAVLSYTPNGTDASIWNVAGLAADNDGALYALTANGTFDVMLNGSGFPDSGDYGNSALKLSTTNNSLAVVDYFTTSDTVAESAGDVDLGSGSPLVLPDQVDAGGVTRRLLIGGGKDGNLLVLDREHMGKFSPVGGNNAYQLLNHALPGGLFSAPAYFNGSIYVADVGGTLKAFALTKGLLASTPSSHSAATFGYPGTSPTISANGTSNAILWAIESSPGSASVLHAYNPLNLAVEYYNSRQAANNRDGFGAGEKFITPVVANGKVFVGTPSGVAVFGLL